MNTYLQDHRGGSSLTDQNNLSDDMRALFSSLADFRMGLDEEIELTFTPYPVETGPEIIARYEEISAASRIPLAHGPACEFYVAVTDSAGELPMPVDPRKLLISWRMREKTEDEEALRQPVGKARSLHLPEPSLILTNVYPVDKHHGCEARFYFHRSRHPGTGAKR